MSNWSLLLLAVSLLLPVHLLPIMRMKLCVASQNPNKLQNQCVYCHNKRFTRTVRQCTGNPYLPANVTIEEGYCMIRQCRSQMPSIRPEPFYVNSGPNNFDTMGINVADDYMDDAYVHSPVHHDAYNGPKPSRPRRPPAQVYIGQPLRPARPSFFSSFGRRRRSLLPSDELITDKVIVTIVDA